MVTDIVPGSYSRGERIAIIASCMLGFMLDLYDVLILPFLMTSIQKSFDIGLAQVASLTSLTLIGSVVGGGLFGWLGDRLGRKTALQYTLGVFALGAIASAFAPNFTTLAVLRFVSGIGLGGEWGAGMVLFNEAWNQKRRGLGSACIQGMAVLASSGASVVAIWAITTFGPDRGWRIALLTGGAPLLLMVFIRFFMPESKVWRDFDRTRSFSLATKARAKSLTFVKLIQPDLRRITIIALVWMMAYMFCYYALVTFIPTLMLKVQATPPSVVKNAAILVSIIGGATYLAMGWLNDRLGRRFGALVPAFFWLASLIGMFETSDVRYAGSLFEWPFFWCFVLFGMGNTALGVVGTWLSELYPVDVRATAVSSIYMAGRGLSSVAPVVVPMVAALAGDRLVIGMMVALPAALIFMITTLMLPETLRRLDKREGTSVTTALGRSA